MSITTETTVPPPLQHTSETTKEPRFWHALAPVLLLVVLIVWGMIIGPMVFDLPS